MEEMHNEEKFIKEGVEYSKTDIEKALEFLSTNTTKRYKSDNTGEEYSILYKNNRYAIKLIYEQMRIAKGLEYENKITATSIKTSFSTYYEILPRIGNNENPGSKKSILENLKKEFKSYLNNLYPNGYDKTYEYDPFYLINDRSTDIKDFCKENNIYFWKLFENDDNLERYYQVLKEKRPANTHNSYISSTNRLKDFFNQKYGGYINWLRTLSKTDNQEINFELIEDWAINYLGKYHSAGSSDSGTKGPKVIGEFKKLGNAVVSKFSDYTLSYCTSWQNSGKIYPYLWIQFKHKNWQDSPCSISMFVIKENDKAKLCIETEIDDKNAKSKDYENFLRTLNTTFAYDNQYYWEDENATSFQNIESALTSVEKGKSKKIKTIKLVNSPYVSVESNRIINELQAGFEILIPRYESIFESKSQQKENNMNIPLNQILYGPPGTGKTYKANQIINVFNKYNEDIFKTNKKISKDLSDLTWSEAIALGMSTDNQGHTPNEIYELKYTKEYLDNKKQSGRKTPECSLRSDLMRNTIKNEQLAESGKTGKDYFVYENGKYKLSDNGKLLAQELLKAENEKFNVSDFCKFVTFHQSYSYEDFVIGIKPKEEEDNLLFKKQRGIFKKLCDEALNNPDYKYLLIIDEINRGNISKIFGELITLIEDKKRWGNEEQMSAILPTGDVIKVPNNLYIIGTMNTADKSLALLDTALRRRFEFIPMYPKYIIEDENGNNIVKHSKFLKSLNEEILKKKQSADYMIGHSYFMNDKSLEEILNVSVIPLLMEYFNNKVIEVKILLDKIADIKYNSEYLYDNDKYFYLKVETAAERTQEEK